MPSLKFDHICKIVVFDLNSVSPLQCICWNQNNIFSIAKAKRRQYSDSGGGLIYKRVIRIIIVLCGLNPNPTQTHLLTAFSGLTRL